METLDGTIESVGGCDAKPEASWSAGSLLKTRRRLIAALKDGLEGAGARAARAKQATLPARSLAGSSEVVHLRLGVEWPDVALCGVALALGDEPGGVQRVSCSECLAIRIGSPNTEPVALPSWANGVMA